MVHRAESSPRRRVPGLVERTLEAVERSPEQFPIALRDIRKALVRRFRRASRPQLKRGPLGSTRTHRWLHPQFACAWPSFSSELRTASRTLSVRFSGALISVSSASRTPRDATSRAGVTLKLGRRLPSSSLL